jgi:Met-zincin
VLTNLLSSPRFVRLVEQEAIDGISAYTPSEFLADVRKGVWKELDAPQVKIDAYCRNLQRAYLDLVNGKLNGAAPGIPANLQQGFPAAVFATSGDQKPFYRAELKALNSAIGAALAKAPDRETKAHLEAARDQIAKILDPKFANSAAAGAGPNRAAGDQLDPFLTPPDQLGTCGPDYVIRP